MAKFKQTPSSLSNAAEAVFQQCQQQFQQSKSALKKQRNHCATLLLGPSGSGKTHLLANSKLALSCPTQSNLDNIKTTTSIDYWIAPEGIFIDTSGKYFNASENNDENNNDWQGWDYFLKWFMQQPAAPIISQVVIAIDFPSLVNNTDILLKQCTRQLHLLRQYHHPLSIHIVLTHCDKITGFNEFFADLPQTEREQCMGVQLPFHPQKPTSDRFSEQYKKLVTQIGQQLIWHLHHERNLSKRAQLKEFPVQLEQMGSLLDDLIHQLPFNQQLTLKSVYLTSSLQTSKNNNINLLDKPLKKTFHITPVHINTKCRTQQAYFIPALFQKLSQQAKLPSLHQQKKMSRRLLAFPIAAAIILGFTLLWHLGFRDNLNSINLMQKNLTSAPNNSAPIFKQMPWLMQLNQLNKTIHDLQQHRAITYRWVGLRQTEKLKQTTNQTYQKALLKFFKPYIEKILTTQIQSGLNNDKLALYNALRSYLMLTNTNHFNANLIQHWFIQYWQKQYPNNLKIQVQLEQYLMDLLKLKSPNWSIDTNLIANARKTLQQLPAAELAFLVLQGEYKQNNISLLPNANKMPLLNLKEASIPVFYSQSNFNHIYQDRIPELANNLKQSNWVIGKQEPMHISPKQKSQFIAAIRALYLKYYSQQWAMVIPNIRLIPAHNFKQTQALIQLLLNKKSSLQQLINIIAGNATLKQNNQKNNLINNKSFIAVNNLIHQKGHYAQIRYGLLQLSDYIKSITRASNSEKASFLGSVARFKNNGSNDPITDLLLIAQKQPQPIQLWLDTIALSSWKTMLTQTRLYLSNIWSSTIVPTYNKTIENRYPIFANAKQDISLKDFTNFFGPNGSINIFFNYYLQNFANMQHNYWTWKKLDGLALPIPQKSLDMLIRASMIQQMFYTDNRKTPSFQFSMTPIKLSNSLEQFILNLGGQMLQLKPGNQQAQNLSWPGPDTNFVTLRFNLSNGKNPTITTTGPWAWFKLIDQSSLEATNNARVYRLTFTLDGQKASYQIITDHLINPYIPGILTAFRCPKQL